MLLHFLRSIAKPILLCRFDKRGEKGQRQGQEMAVHDSNFE